MKKCKNKNCNKPYWECMCKIKRDYYVEDSYMDLINKKKETSTLKNNNKKRNKTFWETLKSLLQIK